MPALSAYRRLVRRQAWRVTDCLSPSKSIQRRHHRHEPPGQNQWELPEVVRTLQSHSTFPIRSAQLVRLGNEGQNLQILARRKESRRGGGVGWFSSKFLAWSPSLLCS